MRRIVTAITVAALAFSLVAQATPAAAVAGYDSSYAGESAFLNLDQGDDGSFTVFFANTGTTTWARGSSTQVDLAACTEDKTTCNAQDTSEADFNNGWTSATRYATTTQSSVAPGSIGTFTYNVTVPDDAEAATYRFNGALVLSSTGADIRNEGYYQDVTVAGGAPTEGAATLDELDPTEGTVEGGDAVTITGEDIDCDPDPTVTFGDNEAEITSCGAEQLVVESPAGDAEGEVDVTVTNAGAEASNALTFEYTAEVTEPAFESISVEGQIITLTFSEPVCVTAGDELTDGTDGSDEDVRVLVNGDEVGIDDDDGTADDEDTVDTDAPECDEDVAGLDAETTFTITVPVDTEIVEGDTVSVSIRADGADEIQDVAENTMDPTTRTAEAEADVTGPTVDSIEQVSDDTIEVTLNEAIGTTAADCDTTTEDWSWDPDDGAAIEPDDVSCEDDTITLEFPANTFDSESTGDLEYEEDGDGDALTNVQDLSGNDLADFDTNVEALEAQGPIIENAELTTSAGLSLTADSGDEFVLTFDEDLETPIDATDKIRVQDGDGTIADIICSNAITDDDGLVDARCTYNSTDNELTVHILENTDEPGDDATDTDTVEDNDELVASGETQGLQWGVDTEIIDTSGLNDAADNDVNLAGSEDVTINDE